MSLATQAFDAVRGVAKLRREQSLPPLTPDEVVDNLGRAWRYVLIYGTVCWDVNGVVDPSTVRVEKQP